MDARVGALAMVFLTAAASPAEAVRQFQPSSLLLLINSNIHNYAGSAIKNIWAGIQRTASASNYYQVVAVWVRIKIAAPVLWVMLVICIMMLVMLGIELVLLSAVSLFVKLFRRMPIEETHKWGSIDVEAATDSSIISSKLPLILVQIPMYNEKKVYKLSIAAACALTWPSDRIIIQILDDSTDPVVKVVEQH